MNNWHTIMTEIKTAKHKMTWNPELGISNLTALISKYPNDGMIYLARAEAFEMIGKTDLAFDDFKKANELLPMENWRQKAKAGIHRCNSKSTTCTTEDTDKATQISIVIKDFIESISDKAERVTLSSDTVMNWDEIEGLEPENLKIVYQALFKVAGEYANTIIENDASTGLLVIDYLIRE